MILNTVENGPLLWPTVEENNITREKNYEELSKKEKLQADCDLKATNIALQGTIPSLQKRECKLYNEFDKFTYVKGESLLPPEWSKFMTDVKLARDLHTSSYDQLYAYLEQHEAHANEALLMPMFSPRYPSTNNQLITSSNLRNHATIQDGRVTVQQVQETQVQNVAGMRSKGNASGQVLDEEQLAFLADPGVVDGQVAQPTITHNAAFQTDDLDAYDSDCDDFSLAKAFLMANLLSCDSEVLSEVPHSDIYQNDMVNQSVQEMQYSEQSHIDDFPDNEITSDSNIIPYSQYLQETQNAVVQDTNSTTQQNYVIISIFEKMSNEATN
ncbi:hypothetical protein Tco_1381852 [Tanacetum coccineum]